MFKDEVHGYKYSINIKEVDIMKSMILKKIKEEFGIKKVGAKKLEQYNFYELCSIHKRLSRGEVIK